MKPCLNKIFGTEFSEQEIAEAVQNSRLLSMEIVLIQSSNSPTLNGLSKEEIFDVIRQARELGARKISIFDDESMLHHHVMELIRYIRSLEMKIELFTCGANISKSVAQELSDNGVRTVHTNSISDESYQDISNGIGIHSDSRQHPEGTACMRHQFSCSVNSEGYVQSCAGIMVPIGNVKQQSLKEILRDSEIVQDLKNYSEMIKGPCGVCESHETCYGCRGTAYQLTGDYLASDPLCLKNIDRRDEIMFLPVDVAAVIPHKPPMLLIDRLLELKERASVSEMTVRGDMIFVDENGHLDDASYPEIISQAVAAQEGFRRFGGRNPLVEGFLLGIKDLEILGNTFVGDTLRISLYKKAKFGDFGILNGNVYKGEELIARGEIKVWQSEAKRYESEQGA